MQRTPIECGTYCGTGLLVENMWRYILTVALERRVFVEAAPPTGSLLSWARHVRDAMHGY